MFTLHKSAGKGAIVMCLLLQKYNTRKAEIVGVVFLFQVETVEYVN